jgi:hypothetical protein
MHFRNHVLKYTRNILYFNSFFALVNGNITELDSGLRRNDRGALDSHLPRHTPDRQPGWRFSCAYWTPAFAGVTKVVGITLQITRDRGGLNFPGIPGRNSGECRIRRAAG